MKKYVIWNIHEQQTGQFDFTGNQDVAAFCRLAQRNGMYVIVRPGPYVCAEWEKGSTQPHLLVIDLGAEQAVTALEYLPRAEQGAPGSVKDYRIYIF